MRSDARSNAAPIPVRSRDRLLDREADEPTGGTTQHEVRPRGHGPDPDPVATDTRPV